MMKLRLGQFKFAGAFQYGQVAYEDGHNEVLVCVKTNTNRPHAFRRVFRQKRDGEWIAAVGPLRRFGLCKELSIVHIDQDD